MTRWNPNDPSVVGPEYLGVSDSPLPLLGIANQRVQRFRSNSAETIGNIRLYGEQRGVGYPSIYLAEIVDAGDELSDGAVTTDLYLPNAVAISTGTVSDFTGGLPVATDIDDWPPDYGNGILMGSNAQFVVEFGSAGFAMTGRIAAVAVEVAVPFGYPPLGTVADPLRRTTVGLRNGGLDYGQQTRIIPNNNSAGTSGRWIFSWGEINPITGLPWGAGDITNFDSGTTVVTITRQPGDGGYWKTAAIRLIVVSEDVERRQAVGVYTVSGSADAAWSADIPLLQVDATPNWSKADATDYGLVLRQADRGGLTGFGSDYLNMPRLQAATGETAPADLDHYTIAATTVTAFSDNNMTLTTQQPLAAGVTQNVGALTPFVLRTIAPATSADGQPYVEVRTTGMRDGFGSTEQELTPGGTDDYAGLRVTLGYFLSVPTGDLTVDVKRRSDDVVMGTFTITPDEMLAAGGGHGTLALVETKAPAPGIALASGVQYYLDFSSGSLPGVWLIGLLSVLAGGGGVLYEEATYRGGTDRADPILGDAATTLDYTPADIAAVIDAAVDGPANFTATADIAVLPDEQPCPLDGIPFVALTWDATALAADFAYYQIERLGPDTAGWQIIAEITDETVEVFTDYEARLGVQESYRISVYRTDGASSYVSDTETATLDPAGCGYTFTSNEQPELSVAYPDVYDGDHTRSYGLPEAEEVQFRRMFGRDYQVAFHGLSRRGVTFARRLIIGGLAAPAAGVGPPAAGMIRDLAWATLSYVCVRDQDGNRYLANLRVSQVDALTMPADVYFHWVDVEVVEVTSTPSIADAMS